MHSSPHVDRVVWEEKSPQLRFVVWSQWGEEDACLLASKDTVGKGSGGIKD